MRMTMKDEMVKVLLYENGEVEIESAEDKQATQHMFFRDERVVAMCGFVKKEWNHSILSE